MLLLLRRFATAAALVIIGVVVEAACAAGHEILPGESPPVTQDEGLLALSVHADCPLVVTLCVDGDLDKCFSLGPQRAEADGAPPIIGVVRAGALCVERYACESGDVASVFDVDRERQLCVDVAPGAITDAGTLDLQREILGNTAFERGGVRFVPRAPGDDVRARIDAAYPQLAGVALRPAPAHRRRA